MKDLGDEYIIRNWLGAFYPRFKEKRNCPGPLGTCQRVSNRVE